MGLLEGRVVIVTGGGRGLGRSHCLELARQGAMVVVNDLGLSLHGESEDGSVSPAEEVVSEIEAAGGAAVVDGTSVTDWDGMAALVERTVEMFGDLHAVVNNAGFIRDRMLVSMTEQDFDAVVAVHLKGTAALTRHACAYWRDQSKLGRKVTGRVVMTTSGAGLFGNVGQANYGSAKGAIATLAGLVALEMQRYGVTANAVSPIAATRMLASIGRSGAGGEAWDPLDPANASPVVAWLCSEESGWLSGSVLRVDGNTVRRVRGWTVEGGYKSTSGEALTTEELGLGIRKLFGAAPLGLAGA
ncbi:MAG: SDR family NAD(P)-dependent oxidoreductase [Acidobacteriota bacterium]|nr:SDR family NAD(P)-dependent oxidoreductase [Acidobacteriota bacterium]